MKKHIEETLHSEIPITKSIGILVKGYSENGITLAAPLSNNINHKNTAFGGSLYSVCVLTGWSLIYALMTKKELSGHIVIQESNIKYLKPVTSDINASSCFRDENQINRFVNVYRKKRISRITLIVTVKQNNIEAVRFEGRYVVHQ